MNNMFKEKEPTSEEGMRARMREEQKRILDDFREEERMGAEAKKAKEKEKELTPEQAAEKKQKENKMFENLAEAALCKDYSHLDIDLRQKVPSNIEKAIEWLKLSGRSFEDSKKWTKDKIKELAKEAKKKKDKKRIELCRELKGALRFFKEERE